MTGLEQDLLTGIIYPHELFSCLYHFYYDRFIAIVCGGGHDKVLSFWHAVRGGAMIQRKLVEIWVYHKQT